MAADGDAEVNGAGAHDSQKDAVRENYKHRDSEAEAMVIDSLRTQVQDLFTQVTQLNGKLVKSYNRVSDLEDELHVSTEQLRSSSAKVSSLEDERTQHLAALNTGLLVEKSHVTTELNRLMEKATEEAAQRGQAESARIAIEKDLDDLSASLFDQANTMVAEARYQRALSERKVEESERALKIAEEAVAMMQAQMQALQEEKEVAMRRVREAQMRMGKGKWADRGEDIVKPMRLLSSHSPYQEFLLFVAHLRSIHPQSPQAPAMTTLLQLPFLARMLNEDSEPTLRLDLAPSLNWLSRRSVLAAIHTGQLTIEPMSAAAFAQEVPAVLGGGTVSCAMCGTVICSAPSESLQKPPQHPSISGLPQFNARSWSKFSNPFASSNGTALGNPASPTTPQPLPSQVFIFRLTFPTGTSTGALASIPLPLGISSGPGSPGRPSSSALSSPQSYTNGHTHSHSHSSTTTTIYPLCPDGWCLSRMRTTCSLWAFVRTGIVDKVWEEEVPNIPPAISPVTTPSGEKPPVPPRRRGLWGMASALGERAASWTDGSKSPSSPSKKPSLEKAPSMESTPSAEKTLPEIQKGLPSPPPVHPTMSNPPASKPPLPRRSVARTSSEEPTVTPTPPPTAPPPLPRRHEARSPATAASIPAPPASPRTVPLPESRPGTPVRAGPASRPGTPTGGPPILPPRAAARLSMTAGTPPPRAETPPVATGGPPPVPRRAVARGARPMSAHIRKSSDLGASPLAAALAPAVDAPAPAADVQAGDDEEKEGRKVSPPAMKEEGSSDTEAAFVDAHEEQPSEGGSERKSTDGSERKSLDAVPESSDAAAEPSISAEPSNYEVAPPEGIPVEASVDNTDPEPSPQSIILSPKPTPAASLAPTVSLDSETSEQDDATIKEVSGIDGVVNGINGVSSDAAEDDSASASEEDAAKSGIYVGEATWEERTWKELVRLREDMFWARIGRR
ncbi:hypothetical protein BD626DRAFT_495124 [Schizophyllum amplum]|uniref:GDP/GTP exchange factor Sec2 N-terminal domain-containing protein n=1 Tax=Schizophyllum amplum TaxID=97359 RepID=A0A550CFX9_9AGAR|nr:hypothetical protein BD626DRAFT_495124 [Auriculariopsis ampla]